MAISVAIVEDHNTLRRQWVERFDFFESVYIVFDADSGEACLHKLEALPPANQPAVILMDIELPGMSGIQTTLRIKDRFPAIDILMLTVFEEDEKIFSSIQAGASGYLLKDISTESLVRSIEELHAGGAPMAPRVARKLMTYVRTLESPTPNTPNASPPFNLSKRELELLEGLIRDETDLMIAGRLSISHHTVRTHFKNIYKKLHVHSRAGAVRVALENKLLS